MIKDFVNDFQHLNDEWKNRYASEAKGIAINNGQFGRLPWEILLWGSGPIPGMPLSITLPESVLAEFLPGRKAALGFFGATADSEVTVKDMIRTATQNYILL